MSKAFQNVVKLNQFQGYLDVKGFGAVGDGVADDTAAIQAAIDYAIYTAKVQRVYIPSGRYKITDTIHLGYGGGVSVPQYTSITLEGDGGGYRGESQFGASVLLPTFEDRPAIAVQGARNTRIRYLCILGTCRSFIDSFGPGVTGNIRDAANWTKPTAANSRFKVYCGVAVDPYSGPAPSPGYPNVTYPAVVGGGAVAQYNKAFSSDVLIEDCYIGGFVAGLAVQPCNADGNGDFVRCDHTVFEYLTYGVVVGNTQSRLVRLSYCQFTRLHTALENTLFGRGGSVGQAGTFNSHVDSCEFRTITQMVDLDPALSYEMTFTSCYAEDLWRIGNVRKGVARASSMLFNGCTFSFAWQKTDPNFGIPEWIMQTDQAEHTIIFNACAFKTYWSVLPFRGAGVIVMNGCHTWLPDPAAIGTSSISNKSVLNHTLGGIVVSQLNAKIHNVSVKTDTRWNLETGNAEGGTAQILRGVFEPLASRNLCFSLFAQQAVPSAVVGDRFFVKRQIGVVDKGSSTVSLTSRTLTVTNANLTEANCFITGGLKGDILLDENTSSVFVVTGHSGTTITAELMNNFYIDGGGAVQYLTAISTSSGALYISNARLYASPAQLTATTTSGSRVITNVQRDDGFGGNVQSGVSEGDAMFVDTINNRMFANDPKISTKISTTGDITSGTATLTVGVNTIQNGFGIVVAGAGAAGADLSTTVSSGGGTTTLTLAANAGTTVTGAAVQAGGLVRSGIIVTAGTAARSETRFPIQQFIRQPVV